MAEVTVDQVADAMFELVKSTHGKKNLKPMDVTKAMIEKFGEDDCRQEDVQEGHPPAHRLRPLHLQVCRWQLRDAAGRLSADPPPGRRPGAVVSRVATIDTEDEMAEKKRLSGPERQKFTIDVLRQWQGIERDAIETTAQIMEKTDNLLIRQIMEIIRNDSVQHHRVQQFLIDSMTKTPVTLTPEELAEVWGEIEAHDELERQTIELAKELKEQTTDPVHEILLDYLLRDEEKHDTILGDLEEFKKHMSKLS